MKRDKMNKISLAVMFLLLLLFTQCVNNSNKQEVKIWCLQSDSNIYVRIENRTREICFVPKIYSIQYKGYSDTAYFSGVSKKNNETEKYYYDKFFSDPVIVFKRLDGLDYMSHKKDKIETSYFQFQPPELIKINANGVFLYKIPFVLSRNIQFACFKIYKEDYIGNVNNNYESLHSYDNFIEYENNKSINICVGIYSAIKY